MEKKYIKIDITVSRCPLGTAADCDVFYFVSDKPFSLMFHSDGGETEEYKSGCSESGRCDGFGYSASPGELVPGLYFYHFIIEKTLFPEEGEFQLTVYSGSYLSPEGYAGGLIYQIFPDRFAFCPSDYKPGEYPERRMHNNLSDVPDWRPDDNGEVHNNDYFGGNLNGIENKLDYLADLGVTAIYLNPVFEAHSNHRYNTADYMKIDPMLGSEEDFIRLCGNAHSKNIKIILDGVFNHTGDDSIYFNRKCRYTSEGACQSTESRWYNWYHFTDYPAVYTGWWGIESLPDVDENSPDYRNFICGDDGVIDKWLSLGADGFRLDVADELPDDFIKEIRAAVKKFGNDRILIGEVWEDASNKISYGVRRHYLQGFELDSVMNYPLRNAIIGFLKDCDASAFTKRITVICDNYPPEMLKNMMNMLSTHDTPRLLTELCFDNVGEMSLEEQVNLSPARDTYLRAVELEKLAVVLQFTLPGIPSVYYGDERGMMGGGDPFCRGFMTWDCYDENIYLFYKKISRIRRSLPQLASPDFTPVWNNSKSCASFLRGNVLVAVNRGDNPADVLGNIVNPWRYLIREM